MAARFYMMDAGLPAVQVQRTSAAGWASCWWMVACAVQVRNGASLGGNIVTASPIGDINAILMAAGATYTAVSQGGERAIAPQNFVVDRRYPAASQLLSAAHTALACPGACQPLTRGR